jgi:TPR repeat protein
MQIIPSTPIFAQICKFATEQGYLPPQDDTQAVLGLVDFMEVAKTAPPEVLRVALRIFAKCYAKGYGEEIGIEKNEKTAFTLYNKSMEMGDVFAKQTLARCYQLGIGTEKNLDSRFSLLNGNLTAKSICRLAMIELDEVGNALRPRDIYNLFKLAAQNGSLSAESYRGYCYLYGAGVEKNRKMALEILEKTAEQDSFYGIYHLANCYVISISEDWNGPSGDPTLQKYQKDYNKIAALMQRLINKRNSVDIRDERRIGMITECIDALEKFHLEGLGVPQDAAKIIALRNLKQKVLDSGRRYVLA